jgi:phenylacetate-CoA ligase
MSVPTFANPLESPGAAAHDFLPPALEQEVRRIYARSPLYPQRFPLHAEPLQWSCYREIPTLSKKEIVERGHQAFFQDYEEIERGLAAKRFE